MKKNHNRKKSRVKNTNTTSLEFINLDLTDTIPDVDMYENEEYYEQVDEGISPYDGLGAQSLEPLEYEDHDDMLLADAEDAYEYEESDADAYAVGCVEEEAGKVFDGTIEYEEEIESDAEYADNEYDEIAYVDEAIYEDEMAYDEAYEDGEYLEAYDEADYAEEYDEAYDATYDEVEYSDDYAEDAEYLEEDDDSLYYYEDEAEEASQMIDEDVDLVDMDGQSLSAPKRSKTNKGAKKSKGKAKSTSSKLELIDSIKEKIMGIIDKMGPMDYAIAATGIITFIIAIVAITTIVGHNTNKANTQQMYELGNKLATLGDCGSSSLVAISDANAVANIIEDTVSANEVSVPSNDIRVTFTSISKDLKIKFINTGTEKLESGIAFEVTLKPASGNPITLTDDDKDGIIYDNDIKPGEYEVTVTPIDEYAFIGITGKVTVKDQIVYQQIDVAEEIKTESEINVSVEDTAPVGNAEAEAEAEPTVKDTVEWVESTRTAADGSDGYRRVGKDSIAEPSYAMFEGVEITNQSYAAHVVDNPVYVVRVQDNQPESTPGQEPTQEPTPDATPEPTRTEVPTQAPAPTATPTATLAPTSRPTPTPTPTPTSRPTPTPTPTPSPTPAPTQAPANRTATVNVGEVKSMVVGTNVQLAFCAKDNNTELTGGIYTFKSSDTSVITVDANGKLVAIKAGTAKITVDYVRETTENGTVVKYTGSATITVTVTANAVTGIKVDPTEVTIAKGKTKNLGVTLTLSDGTTITDASKFTFTSDKTSVATVDATGTITAKANGTATITVTYKDENGKTYTATCKVTVANNPEDDTTTLLKDKDGNQVYIKNSQGAYVKATYADYYKYSEFYIESNTSYSYTGWQTINGNVYFYDKNGNKVTGDQVIQGVSYHFTGDGILAMDKNGVMGIDVSKWNSTIDWNAVKNSGISFVIIRCGYRGSSSGVLVEDPRFRSNIAGASAAGLKVGIYFFTQAVNEVEAVEEASMVLSLVKGYSISYPIFIDTERSGGRADGIDKATRTAVCRAFCETIKNGGYTPGVYASKAWYNDRLSYSSLSGYRIWLAQYASAPSFANRYDLWQYSEKGSVSGISGRVDMNISYMGY